MRLIGVFLGLGLGLVLLESGEGGPRERQALITACWNAGFEDVPPVRDFPRIRGSGTSQGCTLPPAQASMWGSSRGLSAMIS